MERAKKLIVIGGVAAGMSAASKLKRLNENARVTVYEKGEILSYGACGLPYYISDENDDYTKLIARTKDTFQEMGMEIFTSHEAMKVIPENKQVIVKNLKSGEIITDEYDQLMISTGTFPLIPDLPGVKLEHIHVLKTLEDGIRLKEIAMMPNIQNVVIVGGGYVGIEVAEAMLRLGKTVRIIQRSDRILKAFDKEMTDLAEAELIRKGVLLHLNEKVESFNGNEKVEGVATDRGVYEADLVLLAAGVRPATGFLEGSGILLAENGAIKIDREMRTSVDDIYSAGDCAEVYHRVKEEHAFIPLGTNANKCGRIAGANIAGDHVKYVGTLGSAAIKVCDLEIGRTGLSEKEAEELSIEYTSTIVKSADHPRYYPNQTPIWIKLICEKGSRRILGAQAAGQKGAVLRVDMFAIAIHNRMSADELGMTDLCYAPPFAGVWDAVHLACNAVKH